jgi:hypothetical protein
MSQVDIVGVQHYTPGIGHPKTSAPAGGSVLALNGAGQIITPSGQVVGGGVRIIFNGQTGSTEAAAQYNDDLLDALIDQYHGTAVTIYFGDQYGFRRQHIARSAVILECAGRASAIQWRGIVADEFFFVWSRNSSSPAQQSEDGQLIGCGVRNFYIQGDRQTLLNGLWFNGVDFPIIEGECEFVRGTSLRMSNTREAPRFDWRTRFCGNVDLSNAANTRPDVDIDISTPSWDASNLNSGGALKIYYPFGPGLRMTGGYSNFFSILEVHDLGRADADLEPLYVSAIPTYNGQPSALGWDSSGNPRNEYAALHVGAPSVANVSGRLWQDAMHQCVAVTLRRHSGGQASSRNRFGLGRIIGGGRLYSFLVEGQGSDAAIANMEITSCQPWAANVTINAGTDAATVSSLHATSGCNGAPPSGTPVLITGTPPAPLAASQVYYLIRVSATQVRFARTYAHAIAGTAIDLTSAGSTVVLYAGGIPLCALDGAEIAIDEKSLINDGSIAAWHDPSSIIQGMARTGSAFSNGSVARHAGVERLLFVARDVYLDATGDAAQMRKVFGGRRWLGTRAFVQQKSSVSCAGATVGVFTASAAGGTAIIAAAALTGLTTANATLDRTFAVTTANPFGADGTGPYINVSAGGSSGACADVYIYGYSAD